MTDRVPDREEIPPPHRRAVRRTARLVRQITSFGRRHGGAEGTEGTVEYLGQRGARIVLVAPDGTWGDLIAPTLASAHQAVASAHLTVHDTFGPELAAKVRTGPYEWSRMAGAQLGGRTRG